MAKASIEMPSATPSVDSNQVQDICKGRLISALINDSKIRAGIIDKLPNIYVDVPSFDSPRVHQPCIVVFTLLFHPGSTVDRPAFVTQLCKSLRLTFTVLQRYSNHLAVLPLLLFDSQIRPPLRPSVVCRQHKALSHQKQ